MQPQDMIGLRVGRWTIISVSDKIKIYTHNKVQYYNCICDCGTEKVVSGQSLANGTSTSCGCLHKENARARCLERAGDLVWSEEEMQLVRDNYGIIPYPQLLEMLPKRGVHNVRKMAEKLGLTQRRQKYTYNHNYFSELTNESCYWAGFIAADGSIGVDKSNQHTLTIVLQDKDRQHLAKFVQATTYTKPVQYKISRLNGKDFAQAVTVYYGSREFTYDLNQHFNITPNKSLTLQPPNIVERDHIISYLAGYIDGDGTIYYGTSKYGGKIRKGQLNITMLGTYDFLSWCKAQIELTLGGGKSNVTKHKNVFAFGIHGDRAEQFKSIVLSMGLPLLERKWHKEWISPEERKAA